MSATLLFGIHCHQPVGNFDSVFERAFERAYAPFVKEVLNVKNFKFSIHMTGPLLEWIKENRRYFFDTLGKLISDNRVELQISGFYEPILAVIPSWDRIGQICMAKEFVKREFGVEPKGLWLTERIWDPKILKDIVACGIEYVILDDYHLVCSGLNRDEIQGYYITEDEGEKLFLFPINEKLRYLIPFREISEIAKFLESSEGFLTIYDDGEKFGIWPGTYDWVYKKGWLKRFLKAVDEGIIKCALFSQVLKETSPTARIYPPITSYFEMGEWSLPPQLGARFCSFVEGLKKSSKFEELLPFVRGGIWYNFLVKYEESNRMHKRMLWISKKLKQVDWKNRCKVSLFKAQCNDAYWHGIFGGLYLPHLRRAIYSNLSEAEDGIPSSYGIHYEDIDCDGKKEFLFRNPYYTVWIHSSSGGQIKEFTVKRWHYNLVDVLTRRIEHYHIIAHEEKEEEGVASIHNIPRKLKELPEIDSYDRGAFIDRLFFKEKVVCLANKEYEVVDFSSSFVRLEFKGEGFKLRKEYLFKDEKVCVIYAISSFEPFMFETEVNINPGTPDAILKTENDEEVKVCVFKDVKDVKYVTLQSPFLKDDFSIRIDKAVRFFAVPIYTLSQSEKGFDKIFQETALIFKLEEPVRLLKLKIDMEVVNARTKI